MGENKISREELKIRQVLPLSDKIYFTLIMIKQWYERWGGKVYVAFSGGKDSTVLLYLVRSLYPDVPAVFFNTGLEFPEIYQFIKTIPNVLWIKPKWTFKQVLDYYGYPIISKAQATAISRYRNTKDPVQKYRRLNGWPNGKKGMISKKWQFLINAPFKISAECCNVLKIQPALRYVKNSERVPFIGEMASDSAGRKDRYLKNGCNRFYAKKSTPLGFWREEDIWNYIKKEKLPHSKIYPMGYKRTGCIFCMLGIMKDKNRFIIMRQTHPKLHKYCINKLGLKEVLDYIHIPY